MNRNLGNFLMKKYYLLQESNNYLESMFSNPGIKNYNYKTSFGVRWVTTVYETVLTCVTTVCGTVFT